MGAVETTYTFTATDTITSTKMNNIIDQTVMTSDAIIGTTLELSSSKLRVRSAGITSNELAPNSVTTTAITDANVTAAKLATDSVITAKLADDSVTAAKLAADSVTTVKILDANVTPAKLSQKITSGTAVTATGTSVDFTSIPSWVKRITILFNGVSVDSGTVGLPIIQIGDSGGLETTGYTGRVFDSYYGITSEFTNGFGTYYSSAASVTGTISATITLISSNTWVYSMNGVSNDGRLWYACGLKQLSATLDRLSAKPHAGNFDAGGTINIIYE